MNKNRKTILLAHRLPHWVAVVVISVLALACLREEPEKPVAGDPRAEARELAREEAVAMESGADFTLGKTYRVTPGSELDIPVTAILGNSDPEATPDEMTKWAEFSNGNFSLSTSEGGHFLFKVNPTEFAKQPDKIFAELEVTNVA